MCIQCNFVVFTAGIFKDVWRILGTEEAAAGGGVPVLVPVLAVKKRFGLGFKLFLVCCVVVSAI